MKKTLTVLLASLALVACGGKKEGKFNETQAKQSATSNITTANTLNNSTSDTAGETAAGQFQSTALSAGATTITPMAMRMLPGLLNETGAFAAGTRECANKKCTFVDYTSSNSDGSFTLNGAIDWNGGHIVTGPDLTYKLSTSGLDWNATLKVDLTVTATSINGFVESSGKATVAGVGALGGIGGSAGGWEYASKITYNSVTLSNGSPTGGSVTVTADYTVGGQAYTGGGTVNYP